MGKHQKEKAEHDNDKLKWIEKTKANKDMEQAMQGDTSLKLRQGNEIIQDKAGGKAKKDMNMTRGSKTTTNAMRKTMPGEGRVEIWKVEYTMNNQKMNLTNKLTGATKKNRYSNQ